MNRKNSNPWNWLMLSTLAIALIIAVPAGVASDTSKQNSGELWTTIRSIKPDTIVTSDGRFGFAESFKAVDLNGSPIMLREVPLPQQARIEFVRQSGKKSATLVAIQAEKESWKLPE